MQAIAGVVVVALLCLAAWGAGRLSDDPGPSPCALGDRLVQARMPAVAAAVYERHDCSTAASTALAATRGQAARQFAQAQVYAVAATRARAAATDGAARASAPDTDAATRASADGAAADARTRAVATARAADARAAELLREGLDRDAFEPGAAQQLAETTARVAASLAPGRSCLTAQRLVAAGQLAAAREAIGAGALEPRRACAAAVTLLADARGRALRAEATAAAARADGDVAAGQRDDAAALRLDSSLTAPRERLTADAASASAAAVAPLAQITDWLEGIPGWIADAWKWLVVALLLLAALAIAAYRLLQRDAERDPIQRRWIAGLGPIGRRIANLRVSIGELAGDGGADFATAVAAGLDAEPTPSVDRFPAAAAGDVELLKTTSALLAELSGGRIAELVLNSAATLAPPRAIALQGRLLAEDDDGVGVALALVAKGRYVAGTVLREATYDPRPGGELGPRWARLARPATVWARHALRAVIEAEREPEQQRWRAEALNAAGRAWAAGGDLVRARSCYRGALDADPGLLPARSNLAVVAIRDGAYADALALLDQVATRLDDPAQEMTTRWPALREAVHYNSALAALYLAGGDRGSPQLRRAFDEAGTLALLLVRRSEQAGAAAATEAMALLLFASVLVVSSAAEASAAIAGAPAKRAAAPQPSRPLEQLVEQAGFGAAADGRTAHELVEQQLRQRDELSARTRYNVACFYAALLADEISPLPREQRDNCIEIAFHELDIALDDGSLVGWATRDPSLRPLEQRRPNRWRDLIRDHTGAAHAAA